MQPSQRSLMSSATETFPHTKIITAWQRWAMYTLYAGPPVLHPLPYSNKKKIPTIFPVPGYAQSKLCPSPSHCLYLEFLVWQVISSTGKWSPCLHHNPQAFSPYFLPHPVEDEWENSCVGVWSSHHSSIALTGLLWMSQGPSLRESLRAHQSASANQSPQKVTNNECCVVAVT